MKTKFFTLTLALLASVFLARAGAPSTCTDWNGYVDSKNTGQTGYYTLLNGQEEKAAQTYHYSGPGKINRVRVYGNYPGVLGGVALRVSIYNVDASGRPTSTIQQQDATWWWYDNAAGYITVSLGAGVTVSNSFAVGVSIRSAYPYGGTFQVGYTGNGEGLGENLASLAGTSTGGNWASALTDFSKDGDFYLIPEMFNYNVPGFEVPSVCVNTGASVVFSNTTEMNTDSMFNRIGLSAYAGTNKYYTWNFGDGSAVSNVYSPSHTYASAGVYTVTLTTVIDGWNGVCSASYSAEISVGFSVTGSAIANVTCNGAADGSVTAVATGGASPYNYSINGGEYQSNTAFNGLVAGNYTLYATDHLGCSATSAFSITQPSAIVFATPQTTNASCGTANGQVLVSATGGSGQIKYRKGTGSYTTNGLFKNLAAGSYVFTARDTNLCTATITVIVNDQGGPTLTVVSSTNVSCNGGNDGTITLSGSGGTGTLQYSINGGTTYQTTTAYTNLAAGTYSVLVKDAAGCKSGTTVVISQPNPLRINVAAVPVSCFGGNDGKINVVYAIGGIGSLSYSLNGTTFQSGTTFFGLSSGTYTVYLKDVTGCMTSTSVTVTQPTAVSASISTTNPVCHSSYDGSISITGTGGAGNYSYSLNGIEYGSSGQFPNLDGGAYTAYVKDEKGCVHTSNVTLTNPSAVSGNVFTTNSTCGNSNGSLLVTASGGSVSGYQYSLDGTTFGSSGSFGTLPSGAYFVVIRDGVGCQEVVSGNIYDSNGPSIVTSNHTNVACNGGSDGSITISSVSGGTGALQYGLNGSLWQASNTFSNLQAGTYTVMVKDANQCIGSVTETLTQPNPILVNPTVVDLTCYGINTGRITITAIGGAGTLAYSNNQGLSFQSGNVFNNLAAGNYSLEVRDAAGCLGFSSVTINQPTQISVIDAVLNVSCYNAENGIISVVGSGGTGTKTYSLGGVSYQSSGTFGNLSGGQYTVFVKDSFNCTVSKTILVTEPTALVLTGIVSDVSCAGGNNGVIDISVTGGVGNYDFVWNGGSNSEDLFNLPAGNYSTTVTDANGCTASSMYTVTQPSLPIIVNGTVTGSTGTDGEVDITITGGVGPYTFSWSNGEFTEDITGLNPGTYTVEVTDSRGCATSNVFTVASLTGIGTVANSNASLSIYPNPATDFTTVEVSRGTMQQVDVLNCLGQLVYSTHTEQSKLQINTSSLDAGTYLLKILVNNGVITKRLSVIKQ